MQRFGVLLRVLSVFIILALAVVGVFGIDPKAAFGKCALFSVAVTTPDGFFNLSKETDRESGTLTFLPLPKGDEIKLPQASADGGTHYEVQTVSKQVLGNVIKQSLVPYKANTNFGSVYLSNQTESSVDIENMLRSPLGYDIKADGSMQILIYHTHTTEGYMENESLYYTETDEPRSTDSQKNVIRIGEAVAERLRLAGYGVVHDKTIHDHPGFSGSYSRSADTVKAILKEYPNIKLVIDIHRDSIIGDGGDRVAPVVSVNGKDAAQVMLVMGSQTGAVKEHPDWRKNLQLAVKLQNCFETSYPGFARALLLKSAKYNQDLTKGSILIEVGSDANTLEQALYSAELVGASLVELLKSQ